VDGGAYLHALKGGGQSLNAEPLSPAWQKDEGLELGLLFDLGKIGGGGGDYDGQISRKAIN